MTKPDKNGAINKSMFYTFLLLHSGHYLHKYVSVYHGNTIKYTNFLLSKSIQFAYSKLS